MLKIAVIDNSIFDTNRIIQILKQIQSNTEIQSYNSITSFLTSKNNCDFLLLDIELDKEDGIYESSKCRSILFMSQQFLIECRKHSHRTLLDIFSKVMMTIQFKTF